MSREKGEFLHNPIHLQHFRNDKLVLVHGCSAIHITVYRHVCQKPIIHFCLKNPVGNCHSNIPFLFPIIFHPQAGTSAKPDMGILAFTTRYFYDNPW